MWGFEFQDRSKRVRCSCRTRRRGAFVSIRLVLEVRKEGEKSRKFEVSFDVQRCKSE